MDPLEHGVANSCKSVFNHGTVGKWGCKQFQKMKKLEKRIGRGMVRDTKTFKDRNQWYAISIFLGLGAGAILTPLLHSNFFFVIEIYKAILNTTQSSHAYLLETAQNFTSVLYVGWAVAMCFLTIGWIAYAICVFLGKTYFSKMAGFLTPFVLMVLVLTVINVSPQPISTLFSGAGLSLSYFLFFLFLGVLQRKRLGEVI